MAGRGRQAGLSPPRHGRVAALQAEAGARLGAHMRVSLPPTPSLVITFDEDDDDTVEDAEEGELPAPQAVPKQVARPAPKQAPALLSRARGAAPGARPAAGAKAGPASTAGHGRGAASAPAALLVKPAASAGAGVAEAKLRAQVRGAIGGLKPACHALFEA